jgi:hypothetical protein
MNNERLESLLHLSGGINPISVTYEGFKPLILLE